MINELPDFYAGSALAAEENGDQPVMEDSLAYGHLLGATQPAEPVQVAGVGNVLGRILSRPVERMIKPVLPPGAIPDRTMLNDALRDMARERVKGAQARRVDLEAQAQGGTPPVPIAEGAPSPRAVRGTSGEVNLERAHPGAPAQAYPELAALAQNDPGQILRMVRNADEMGDVLDVVGEQLHQAPRTHAEIRDAGFDYGAVAQALTQEGLANDKQLFALRTMVATLGEKAANIARRIYQGDHSPGLLLEYEKTGQQFMAFVHFTKGQTREVARALSQQNMVADVLSGNDLRALTGALNASTGGDPLAIVNSAGALIKQLDMGVPAPVAFRGAMERHTPFEAFIEWYKANNLSGFSTQAYNMMSSPVVMFAETAVRGIATVVGETRHALGVGSAEYYSAREYQESLIAGAAGVAHGFNLFYQALKTGESQLGAYGGKEIGSSALHEQFSGPSGLLSRVPGMPNGLSPNVSEAVLTPAYRFMKAVDEGMMLPPVMAEMAGLATRDGINLGLTGEALTRHIDMLMMDPTYKIQQDGLEQGRKVVMQASADDPRNAGFWTVHGESLHRYAKANPWAQFVVPWIKTPSRILDYQVESSVLAALSPRIREQLLAGGAQGDIAAGKIVMGVSVTAMMYPLVANMQVTGGGPEDPEQRKALEALGWKAYSFKVGNTYIPYKNWADPVVGLIAGMATALERVRFARLQTDVTKEAMTAAASMLEYMYEASYMDGIKQLFDATRTDGSWIKYVGGLAQGLVPYGGALASAARMQDQTDRAASRVKQPGFGGESWVKDVFDSVDETFRLRFPFLRDTMRPARYWDGKVKVPEGGDIVKHLLPMDMRELRNDPESRELVKHGVKIAEPPSRFDFGTKFIQLELLDLDNGKGKIYDELIYQVGVARREAVNIMINTFNYQQASPAMQGLMLDDAIAKGRQKGEGVFWKDTLLPMVERGEVGNMEKSARETGLSLPQFVQLLLTQQVGRAIVPQSRRNIEVPPALEFK